MANITEEERKVIVISCLRSLYEDVDNTHTALINVPPSCFDKTTSERVRGIIEGLKDSVKVMNRYAPKGTEYTIEVASVDRLEISEKMRHGLSKSQMLDLKQTLCAATHALNNMEPLDRFDVRGQEILSRLVRKMSGAVETLSAMLAKPVVVA